MSWKPVTVLIVAHLSGLLIVAAMLSLASTLHGGDLESWGGAMGAFGLLWIPASFLFIAEAARRPISVRDAAVGGGGLAAVVIGILLSLMSLAFGGEMFLDSEFYAAILAAAGAGAAGGALYWWLLWPFHAARWSGAEHVDTTSNSVRAVVLGLCAGALVLLARAAGGW